MIKHPFSIRIASVFLGLSLLVSFTGTAEIKSPGTIPPQPVPVTIEVQRGKSVAIPLNIYGGALDGVTYRIRTAPKHGTLSEPTPIDGSRGEATYQHSGEFGHDTDTFFYAAKTRAGVSAAVAVRIEIVDLPPKLVTPAEADFGHVLIGTGAAVDVTIANEGGGFAAGTLTASPPWAVRHVSDYSLGPGKRMTFTVECAPENVGEVHGMLKYSSDPAGTTMLHANATLPFRIDPDQLELALDKETLVRSGHLTIFNDLEFEQTLEIMAGDGIIVPETIRIPARGSATVTIQTAPTDLSILKGEISLTGTGHVEHCTVNAAPVPAILEVEGGRIDFGSVRVGTAKSIELSIRNRGGERTNVYADTSAPFAVGEDSAEFTLEPGATRKLTINVQPSLAGNFRSHLNLKSFEHEIAVALSVDAPERRRPERISALSASATERQAPVRSDVRIPLIKPLRVSALGETTATLAWPTIQEPDISYRVEARILDAVEEGKIRVRWIPFTSVELEEAGKETHATVSDLTPRGGYVVRVVAIDGDAIPVRASDPLRVVPKAKSHFAMTPLKTLLLLLAIILATLAYQNHRKRNPPGLFQE